MSWRIAVTSADGVLINQHFGHARWFFIIDIERDGSSTITEKRDVTPWCDIENHGGSEHSCGGKDASCATPGPGGNGIADSITDCIAVITAQIGPPARKKLELAGISVFEEPAKIEDAVKKLAAYYVKTNTAENAAEGVARGSPPENKA
ncbi:dinitrogenase iron-molybdenum cofactor biosynthesis protein [Spirochaetia bacterium]|nr:dinitrogenase iron-molybdenum cofactor biosynthesis protein [Spirochaetia bacterium]